MGIVINAVVMIVSVIVCICWFFDVITSNADQLNKLYKKDIVGGISFIACIISTVLLIVGVTIRDHQQWNIADEPYRTDYIASLNDGTQINGRFYLRHGYIEENMYYQYMVKRSDGGYSYGKAKEDIATIYISDGNYRVEWYKMKRHWLWFDDERSICKIYVPEDCIKEEYSIDLE